MMQTVKCRARHLPSAKFCHMWEVKHPDTGVTYWSDRPHDTARELIERFVLPQQIEPVLE